MYNIYSHSEMEMEMGFNAEEEGNGTMEKALLIQTLVLSCNFACDFE